jgi:hypothetical protein
MKLYIRFQINEKRNYKNQSSMQKLHTTETIFLSIYNNNVDVFSKMFCVFVRITSLKQTKSKKKQRRKNKKNNNNNNKQQ